MSDRPENSKELVAQIKAYGSRGLSGTSEHAEPSLSKPLDDYAVGWLRHELLVDKETHALRKIHTWCLFGIVVVWIVMVCGILILQGSSGGTFFLAESVLMTFITSTTASILGLYGIAAYWLFGKLKDPEKKTKNKFPAVRPEA